MESSGIPTAPETAAKPNMSAGISSSTRPPVAAASRFTPRSRIPARRITPTEPAHRNTRKTTLAASVSPSGIAVTTSQKPAGDRSMTWYDPGTTASRPSGRTVRS